jgi:hypothetical protein
VNSWRHAQSSARKWGGKPEDYLAIHEFIDSSKECFGDFRHRALYHNTQGVWLAQRIFGTVITVRKADGTEYTVPVREIAEQHILQDLGCIPSVGDWLSQMQPQEWMSGPKHKFIGKRSFLGAINGKED